MGRGTVMGGRLGKWDERVGGERVMRGVLRRGE